MLKELKNKNEVGYNEILNIANAFQIASGQGYAIGKTKGMLDFLKQNGEILIISTTTGEKTIIKTNEDLTSLFRNIDEEININSDPNFKNYFI
jgi:hypothetical protein